MPVCNLKDSEREKERLSKREGHLEGPTVLHDSDLLKVAERFKFWTPGRRKTMIAIKLK